jgi:hypothetical protein
VPTMLWVRNVRIVGAVDDRDTATLRNWARMERWSLRLGRCRFQERDSGPSTSTRARKPAAMGPEVAGALDNRSTLRCARCRVCMLVQ